MTESKISPELNMAIGIPEEEREKSLDLGVGYSDCLLYTSDAADEL